MNGRKVIILNMSCEIHFITKEVKAFIPSKLPAKLILGPLQNGGFAEERKTVSIELKYPYILIRP